MKTSFKFKNLIYSIILVPFVFAVLPQQNSSLEKTTEGNSAFSTIDPAKSKNDSYIEQIAMGGGGVYSEDEAHSAAVLVDQNGNESLYTWGSNDSGQLGLGYTSDPIATPQKVTGLPEGDIEQISLGKNYSTAIVNDGSGDELYTWGLNDKGQLGTGEGESSTNNLKPTEVKFGDVSDEAEIKQISTNTAHSAAVVNDGKGDELWTWGTNQYGRLGRETEGNNNKKTQKPGIVSFNKEDDTEYETGEYQIKDVSVGNVSSAAIITDTTDGKNVDQLYTWGNNGQAQCGIVPNPDVIIDDDNYDTPQNITNNFKDEKIISYEDIAVGAQSVAVVAVDVENKEQLYTWGSNEKGQLGIELNKNPETDKYFYWNPQEVTDLPKEADIKEISLYNKSMAVVINSGNGDELWTWGENIAGELGNGGEEAKGVSKPTRIEPFDTNITQVTSGYQSRMAITNNGTSLYVWGNNEHGQLGIDADTYENIVSPLEIDFYLMIPNIPFVQKWYFYFMLVILIFLIIGLIIGLLIYLKKRQLVR